MFIIVPLLPLPCLIIPDSGPALAWVPFREGARLPPFDMQLATASSVEPIG